MKRPRLTNRRAKWRGNTTVMTVRVMDPVAEMMDARLGKDPELRTRSDIIQDALSLWCLFEERNEETNGHAD